MAAVVAGWVICENGSGCCRMSNLWERQRALPCKRMLSCKARAPVWTEYAQIVTHPELPRNYAEVRGALYAICKAHMRREPLYRRRKRVCPLLYTCRLLAWFTNLDKTYSSTRLNRARLIKRQAVSIAREKQADTKYVLVIIPLAISLIWMTGLYFNMPVQFS